MFEDLTSAYGGRLVIAVIGVGIGFLVLIGVLWFIRRRNGPSPFVRGGKNRQPRLQVLDAAAVDTRRRLVLIRRDNVEHLVMIGGPTDIVIESGISAVSAGVAAVPYAAPRFAPADTEDAMASAPMPDTRATRMEPRPAPASVPAQRPAPAAIAASAAEQRFEQTRENPPAPREVPRPAPAVMAQPIASAPASVPTPPRPVHLEATVAVEPVAVPRAEAPARPAPDVKPEPLRPIAALAAAVSAAPAAATSPAIDHAADLLDAARGRVFQETPEPRVIPSSPATVPAALQQVAERPKQLGSDFERILEQEMASNLAAGQSPVIAQPQRQTPPRDPSVPPVTGATREPSLQAEVARIFGEMSVARDK